MKTALTLLVITIFTGYYSFSQTRDECPITHLMAGGGHNFQIIGIESNNMIDSLFANNPEKKRKGYVWRFKRIHIPGIDQSVTFQVHQGLSGTGENCTSYFNTFTSEKYKTARLARKKDTESPTVIIYVKHGRKNVLRSNEEAKIVKDYLLSIYG